jgi:anthranilate/para-aminobenzoate synthase component II
MASRPVGQGGRSPEDRPGTQAFAYGRPIAETTKRVVMAPIPQGPPRCANVKADGTQCGARPIHGLGICVGHQRQVAHADQN